MTLTPKGERYAAEHFGRPAPTKVSRARIERAIERHLSLVTVLLALLDAADGDENLEPSMGYTATEANLGKWAPPIAPDREDDLGSAAMRLPNGTIVNDREATDCGLGVCDDHGIADQGGAEEQMGRVL